MKISKQLDKLVNDKLELLGATDIPHEAEKSLLDQMLPGFVRVVAHVITLPKLAKAVADALAEKGRKGQSPLPSRDETAQAGKRPVACHMQPQTPEKQDEN